jgi:hypothetical protein
MHSKTPGGIVRGFKWSPAKSVLVVLISFICLLSNAVNTQRTALCFNKCNATVWQIE